MWLQLRRQICYCSLKPPMFATSRNTFLLCTMHTNLYCAAYWSTEKKLLITWTKTNLSYTAMRKTMIKTFCWNVCLILQFLVLLKTSSVSLLHLLALPFLETKKNRLQMKRSVKFISWRNVFLVLWCTDLCNSLHDWIIRKGAPVKTAQFCSLLNSLQWSFQFKRGDCLAGTPLVCIQKVCLPKQLPAKILTVSVSSTARKSFK